MKSRELFIFINSIIFYSITNITTKYNYFYIITLHTLNGTKNSEKKNTHTHTYKCSIFSSIITLKFRKCKIYSNYKLQWSTTKLISIIFCDNCYTHQPCARSENRKTSYEIILGKLDQRGVWVKYSIWPCTTLFCPWLYYEKIINKIKKK